jgi:hypothetical protein
MMITETDILESTHKFVAQQLPLFTTSQAAAKALDHTSALVAVAENIGKAIPLSEEDMQILLLSAWLYDLRLAQFKETPLTKGIPEVDDFLESIGLTAAEIDKVNNCIAAARFPQHPQNELEEALCDAVASFLAAPDYLVEAEKENTTAAGSKVAAYDWLINQKDLFKKQAFFTKYGKKTFSAGKANNSKLLKKKQKTLTSENAELEELWEENKKLKKDLEKEKESKASKGIETMFRTTMASHLQLSVMADTKANLMISINAIIASIMISSFLRNINEVPYLIIPSVLLTLVCVFTIVFAVLSTRPNIKAIAIQPEKIDLLFFGDFVHLKADVYKENIRNIMQDHDKLYNTMIDNIYSQGKVLAKKYLLLKIAYNVFMVGFGMVLTSYAIAYLFFAE